MRLIGLVVALSLLTLAPLAAEAQQSGTVWRIGVSPTLLQPKQRQRISGRRSSRGCAS